MLALAALPAAALASDINQNGQVGGLALPTARPVSAGTIYMGAGAGFPYRNIYVGIQPIDALRLVIRQQQDERTEFTYPGFDIQVQLTDEGEWIPASALGYTHAAGQRRFGGEYLVLSKRWWDFDFNLGLGWGRYANDGIFRNPLAEGFLDYKDFERDIGLGSVGPKAWYRGSRMGLFGGVTYQMPVEGLKLHLEYDRDPYFQEEVESILFGIQKVRQPTPFHIGASYDVWRGLNVKFAFYNFSRAQLNLSYAFNAQDDAEKQLAMTNLRELVPAPLPENEDAEATELRQMEQLAWRQKVDMLKVEKRNEDTNLYLRYRAGDLPPYATYLGRAAYSAAEHADENIATITLVPEHEGLTAGTYTFIRRDLRLATSFEGSPEEIRQSATIAQAMPGDSPSLDEQPRRAWKFFTEEKFDSSGYEFGNLWITRSRFLWGATYEPLNGITIGGAGGMEAGDNIPVIPQTSSKIVRSNIDAYTQRVVDIDHLYVNAMRSIAPGLHARITAGLLEEMYRGVSGEILYQPQEARWAVGLEGNWLEQRHPLYDFDTTGYKTQTGALSFYYEVPPRDLTVIARVEQFLAKDHGVSLEFRHQFQQGIQMGFAGSYSHRRDFGGPDDRGHVDGRIYFRIPLQFAIDDVPIRNYTSFNVGSIARDSNQQVNVPVRLWDATRPVSYGPILRSWDDLLNF